ncbi:hypothetical protein DICPUDRAFT_93239 [Dictyostelium purpureum]|uniref:small monomeric GTPase n=1 Tax=Dictyostelium purpureum TaxID=5786 RepID=F1A4E2_DICPU|nr:uncharacterized protein DICPUDRAFT_93239 [Dictyostelium purpureum]EGC28938.1 hypothetical protein DICPUDRAFT_93239 [Dictyostelium purpureum]|eukprot:XP_003294539.1 hypothetical protein DICPUDRAFT_93239 [Dictyostelium purpureum]
MSSSAYKNNIIKLCLMGDGGVGKTAICIQFTSNHFVEYYDPTIEDSYRKQCVIDEQACLLDILDTAGQEELTAMRDQWIRSCEAFIIVYSITSRSSFDQVAIFKEQISRVLDRDQIPMMLLGNKSDLEDLRQVTTQEGRDLARCLGMMFMEVSSKTRTGIEESFYETVREMRRRDDESKKTKDDSHKKKSFKKLLNEKVGKIKEAKTSFCKMM